MGGTWSKRAPWAAYSWGRVCAIRPETPRREVTRNRATGRRRREPASGHSFTVPSVNRPRPCYLPVGGPASTPSLITAFTMANPVIPRIGGRRCLADHIIPRFPKLDCYVEVLAGGAALYFLRLSAKIEVINDSNDERVNLYRVVQHHLDEFVRQFRWALTSRQVFEWPKHPIPETLADIRRAARFYYLRKSCFGGKLERQISTMSRFRSRNTRSWSSDCDRSRDARSSVSVIIRGSGACSTAFASRACRFSARWAGGKVVERREPVIFSWDAAAQPVGLF